MKIHNVTQEAVTELVNEAFKSNDRPKDLCLCNQCHMDVICYVLNRVQPKYIVSDRGISHMSDNYSESLQMRADIVKNINEAMRIVAQAKRTHHLEENFNPATKAQAYFNFPTVSGKILSGINFSPEEVTVELYHDEKLVKMIDPTWENPYSINENCDGNFIFWPMAMPAASEGIRKNFTFEIRILSEQKEPNKIFFSVDGISEKEFSDSFQAHKTITLKETLLFPKDMD